ncbi:hypothetical protein L7F22_042628 [Adiantum nelumboides]|nr:hypothetical protein [Adiantum nelumboides]
MKAPFEIVEGGKNVPPILHTKDKIFEADKYVQDMDEMYKKVKVALEKTQAKQRKAADRHRREVVFSLEDMPAEDQPEVEELDEILVPEQILAHKERKVKGKISYYGGWAAPRIFYLGCAGVIRFGGLRIGGLSGIFKPHDYRTGHHERAPYNESELRSIYHVREYDVVKLLQIEDPLDIFISHDWPRGVAKLGDVGTLLKFKPFLEEQVMNGSLGSKPGEELLRKLKPSYWFAAHLHTKYAALIQHDGEKITKFLALDKCLPRRDFLQVIDVDVEDSTPEFRYDEEWLAITRAYNPFLPLGLKCLVLPRSDDLELGTHREWVKKRLQERGLAVPTTFQTTVPPFNPKEPKQNFLSLNPGRVRNPFTESLLQLLELPYVLDGSCAPKERGSRQTDATPLRDPSEIELNELEDDFLPDDVDELGEREQQS